MNCLKEHNIFSSSSEQCWRGLQEPKNLADLKTMLEVARSAVLSDELDADNFAIRLSRCQNAATRRDAFSDIFPVKKLASSDMFMSQSKQKWVKWVPTCPEGKPKLEAPEPDYAIGLLFQNQDFFRSVYRSFPDYASPGICRNVWIWDRSTEKNALNGAVAVNNILQLKKAIGREESFYDTGHVFSIDHRYSVLTLRVHWVSRIDGQDKFTSTILACYPLRNYIAPDLFLQIRNQMNNLVDWLENVVGKQLGRYEALSCPNGNKARSKFFTCRSWRDCGSNEPYQPKMILLGAPVPCWRVFGGPNVYSRVRMNKQRL